MLLNVTKYNSHYYENKLLNSSLSHFRGVINNQLIFPIDKCKFIFLLFINSEKSTNLVIDKKPKFQFTESFYQTALQTLYKLYYLNAIFIHLSTPLLLI